MLGKLSIVATPIGNLEDISNRAIKTLAQADCICAEDTRVTGRLLKEYDIHTKLERCDENIISKKTESLIKRLKDGEHIAFCSDAGMPGISDPGMVLVDAARDANIETEVLPGACAISTALVSAAFGGTAFYFGGFLPRKAKQQLELFENLKQLDASLVFYESPHRVTDTASNIAKIFPARRVAMCRELTKLHEEVLRLPSRQLAENLANRDTIKGEIVLVIAPPNSTDDELPDFDSEEVKKFIDEQINNGLTKSKLAKELAKQFGFSKNEAYKYLHDKQ